jgi:hypothetical protein
VSWGNVGEEEAEVRGYQEELAVSLTFVYMMLCILFRSIYWYFSLAVVYKAGYIDREQYLFTIDSNMYITRSELAC